MKHELILEWGNGYIEPMSYEEVEAYRREICGRLPMEVCLALSNVIIGLVLAILTIDWGVWLNILSTVIPIGGIVPLLIDFRKILVLNRAEDTAETEESCEGDEA